VKIDILPGNRYAAASSDLPTVGVRYYLQDATEGSLEQGAAFHALVQEYWRSGAHSYKAESFADFRDQIKRDLGAGFARFFYVVMVDGRPEYRIVKKESEIPADIIASPDKRKLVCGRLKSWADYTKKERTESISRLIAEMEEVGVNTPKYREILEGMQDVQAVLLQAPFSPGR
jgi:hypothetical protein